ncbi:unnamed protein product, partial [marine sediment metagenome]
AFRFQAFPAVRLLHFVTPLRVKVAGSQWALP